MDCYLTNGVLYSSESYSSGSSVSGINVHRTSSFVVKYTTEVERLPLSICSAATTQAPSMYTGFSALRDEDAAPLVFVSRIILADIGIIRLDCPHIAAYGTQHDRNLERVSKVTRSFRKDAQ